MLALTRVWLSDENTLDARQDVAGHLMAGSRRCSPRSSGRATTKASSTSPRPDDTARVLVSLHARAERRGGQDASSTRADRGRHARRPSNAWSTAYVEAPGADPRRACRHARVLRPARACGSGTRERRRPTQDSAPAILTERLTKSYGKSRGIVTLDLEVRPGEVFGFLGPNGAGKTTTIRVLLDLIRPTSGRALVLGRDSRRDTLAIQARSGYLPGELSLYPNLTGRETLRYLANLRGGVDWDYVAALDRAPGLRPRAQGGRPLHRQQAQARPHPGVHAPARAAHPRRAHVGPRPARPARVLPPARRGPRRPARPCSSRRTCCPRCSACATASPSCARASWSPWRTSPSSWARPCARSRSCSPSRSRPRPSRASPASPASRADGKDADDAPPHGHRVARPGRSRGSASYPVRRPHQPPARPRGRLHDLLRGRDDDRCCVTRSSRACATSCGRCVMWVAGVAFYVALLISIYPSIRSSAGACRGTSTTCRRRSGPRSWARRRLLHRRSATSTWSCCPGSRRSCSSRSPSPSPRARWPARRRAARSASCWRTPSDGAGSCCRSTRRCSSSSSPSAPRSGSRCVIATTIAGTPVGAGELAEAFLRLTLLGLAVGSVTFAVGGATGRRQTGIAAGAGVGVAMYLLNTLAVMNETHPAVPLPLAVPLLGRRRAARARASTPSAWSCCSARRPCCSWRRWCCSSGATCACSRTTVETRRACRSAGLRPAWRPSPIWR